MKFCRHCGRECLDDAIICPGCGCSVQYDDNKVAPMSAAPSGGCPGMCIAGFVLSFIVPMVGLILSIISHKNAKRDGNGQAMGFSKAGIIISAVSLAISVLVCMLFIIIIAIGISQVPYVDICT